MLILVLTSLPRWMVPQVHPFPSADKFVHFGLYGVWSILLAVSPGGRRQTTARLLVVIACFAAFDEWHQQFIPGRDMSAMDWLADMAGSSLGLLLTSMARRRREHAS